MEIKISNLSKLYGSKKALNNISLTINDGMFGLLGPNGAGKTTLMRILTTLLHKTSGEVSINGIAIEDKRSLRPLIGYLPQEFSLYPKMTVYEAMDYLAILAGIKSKTNRSKIIIDLLEKVNLAKNTRTKVRALSGGMKRRLGIAQALINNPLLLIVDEPTAGLDPEERIRFRNLLSNFANGRIVILSTHIAGDIEFTCNNLAILKEGNLLYDGKVSTLLDQANEKVWSVIIDREDLAEVSQNSIVISTVAEGDKLRLKLLANEQPYNNAQVVPPTIEDAYMKVIRGVI